MDFVLLLLINLAILALMYLVLRHQLSKNYSSEKFLSTLQKEVNAIMTDLNQTTETSVQILSNESEKIKRLQNRVEKRIEEMQQIFSMLDRADGRYNEIILNSRRITQKLSIPESDQQVPAPKNPIDEAKQNGEIRDSQPAEDTPPKPSAREQVIGLYNQGRALDEIAEMTKMPLGEIELIIELSK